MTAKKQKVLTIAALRKTGGIVEKTGKRGKPRQTFGTIGAENLRTVRAVQQYLDEHGGSDEAAFAAVAVEQPGLAEETVKKRWQRYRRFVAAVDTLAESGNCAAAARLMPEAIAEIERRVAGLPDDVRGILSPLGVGDLLALLRHYEVDGAAPAFVELVRASLGEGEGQ